MSLTLSTWCFIFSWDAFFKTANRECDDQFTLFMPDKFFSFQLKMLNILIVSKHPYLLTLRLLNSGSFNFFHVIWGPTGAGGMTANNLSKTWHSGVCENTFKPLICWNIKYQNMNKLRNCSQEKHNLPWNIKTQIKVYFNWSS